MPSFGHPHCAGGINKHCVMVGLHGLAESPAKADVVDMTLSWPHRPWKFKFGNDTLYQNFYWKLVRKPMGIDLVDSSIVSCAQYSCPIAGHNSIRPYPSYRLFAYRIALRVPMVMNLSRSIC